MFGFKHEIFYSLKVNSEFSLTSTEIFFSFRLTNFSYPLLLINEGILFLTVVRLYLPVNYEQEYWYSRLY